MRTPRANSRERILAAAAEVARETGPGSLSLDAVAHRAGVSKGGLLYNFPSKAKLMQALVASYVEEFERELDKSVAGGETLLAAYLRLSMLKCEDDETASWIFSAMAEDPHFLEPVRQHRRRLLDRLKAESSDPADLLIVFFAMEGLLSMKLFDTTILSTDERDMIRERLPRIASELHS
jgi:AcrR family transcriptional regulator